jgi:hypothetical protein
MDTKTTNEITKPFKSFFVTLLVIVVVLVVLVNRAVARDSEECSNSLAASNLRHHPLNNAIAARSGKTEDICRGRIDVTRERLSQQRAGPEETRANGCRRDTEGGGSFVDRHVFDVTHDEDRAKSDRQLVDSTFEDVPDFRAQGGCRWRFRLLVHGIHLRRFIVATRIAEGDDHAFAPVLPQAHQRLIDDDSSEPGAQARVAAKFADAPERNQVGILQDVFGVFIGLENRSRNAE